MAPSDPPKKRLIPWRIALMVLIVCTFGGCCACGSDLFRLFESSAPSQSKGTSSKGSLVNGKRLPTSGPNFTTYSHLGALLGRQATHGNVRALLLDALAKMATTHPKVTFTLGETGWPSGGRFWPHRTHQNGLSVDIMVPVKQAGQPATLSCWPWNKWGYGLEFDSSGNLEDYQIDFEALAQLLLHLDQQAKHHGLRVRRVIFAPNLRPELWATAPGKKVKKRMTFMPKRAWVRHDDHVHVDFSLRR